MKIIININDRLAKFVQKMCTTRNMVFAVAMVLFCAGLFIFSETVNIPNQLHEGDLIVAEELNENFQALRDRDLDSLADVDTSGVADGNVLQFDGADWVPSTFSPTGVWATSGSNIYFNGGNIGIGTASPGANLEVRGNIQAWETDMDAIQGRTTNGTGIYGSSNNGCGVYAHSGSSSAPALQAIQDSAGDIFQLKNTVSTVMVVDSTGNVGIGTTGPGYDLDVVGDINFTGTLYQNGSPFGGGSGDGHSLDAADGSPTDALYVDNTGNVGIGTTAPGAKLHVGSPTDTFDVLTYHPGTVIGVQDNTTAAITARAATNNVETYMAADINGGVIGTATNHSLRFGINGTESMRISTAGNVGIGTTNPLHGLSLYSTSGNEPAIHLTNMNTGTTATDGSKFRLTNAGALDITQYESLSMTFLTSNTPRVTIEGTGNVGIGTTEPTSKLQVTGLPIHADNAAALGAGLTAGAFYHNGDGIVRVVY